MKGTTHTTIGITAVSMINNATIHSILTNPKGILPILAAYIGALICDLDTGSSTVSNSLAIIKLRFFSRFITFMFLVLSAGALLYTRNTEYFKYVAALVIVAALSLSTFISDSYNVVKKVTLVGTAATVIIMGMIYYMPPVILMGLILAALMFSPHRGYSHSLLAVVACFGAVKYACITYNFYDISIYFGLGMLSHIIADMFTERGVALLFPYTKKIKLPITIKTGSPIEHLVTAISLVIFYIILQGKEEKLMDAVITRTVGIAVLCDVDDTSRQPSKVKITYLSRDELEQLERRLEKKRTLEEIRKDASYPRRRWRW